MSRSRIMTVLFACVLMAGCGNETPLSHAINAFRAGDRVEFMKAEAEANEAMKTAIQPGDDLCKVSAADIAKHSAVYMMGELEHPEILARPEEERLAFVLGIAGQHSKIPPGSFLNDAPIASAGTGDTEKMNKCGDPSRVVQAMRDGMGYMQSDDEARIAALQDWIKDLKARDGDRFDSEMRAAAERLTFNGHGTAWPPNVDFGEYATLPSFGQMQSQLK